MYSFDYHYRVRYADIDQMGYMYYGNYAKLYEIGRVEALRSLGLRYRDLEETGIIMPVYENKSRFIAPAKYDDLVTIRVIIKEMPKVRIIFNYEIFDEQETLLHTGETTLVFVKTSNNRIATCPKEITDRLLPFF
ncbi:4-hydroxybenzoyl-CoA thioesterase [Emticicia oligotrophica DSM 17448]|uniref:4-hydroxybenzoyl-CoA thioesterase n=1 Tax=Emticicia oligotrophica (strain DSM 17448 / CIP 109782 / MTCC 6937 / GPTSA100-15) TaxID=929562 RepID=A0ABN4ANS2_EMTOG|nr:thioesterase family protein [Emticicia oligotrophica]AFK04080.1 4-hydroxybenzoyl-CoA thioesterase [Emticicia oligotrophica DSM 17448]